MLRCLHPVFNVIKLTPAPDDPIPRCIADPPPAPELIDGKPEYEVEHILDSCLFCRKLQYKIQWKGYGPRDDLWEDTSFAANAPELIADFHHKNPRVPHHIQMADFDTISFQNIAAGQYNSEGG